MNENKYSECIRFLDDIKDMIDEVDRFNERNQNIPDDEREAGENAIWATARKITRRVKPAVVSDVLDALKNAPVITPEEIDLYIPHVNTPKTIERFMSLAKDGLPHLKGLWLLTEYKSFKEDHCGPDVIAEDDLDSEMYVEYMNLHCSISKYFLHHEWAENRLYEDVIRQGKNDFDTVIAREILEGRVRRIYLDPSIEREENSNEQ